MADIDLERLGDTDNIPYVEQESDGDLSFLPRDVREEIEAQLDEYETNLTDALCAYVREHGDDIPKPEKEGK